MKQPRTGIRLLSIGLLAAAVVSLASLSAPQAPTPSTRSSAYLPTRLSDPAPGSASHLGIFSSYAPGVAQAAPVNTNSSNSVYFQQTGHYVKDAFLNYWLMNGGAATYGYPVSEESAQNGTSVQYFQKARFEYNPNSARPWKVDLDNVGSLLAQGRTFDPATQTSSTPDRLYFDQTQHTVGGAFRQYWQASGGLDIFGYPISEEIQEGDSVVQYFERARFEQTAQGRIQLGNVGSELLARDLAGGLDASVAAAQPRPGFNMSFSGNATWFHADWNRVISLNKGWGNLPQDYVGRGLYAAAPADLNLYGRWARVTRGNRSIFVQFVDVIDWKDIPYVRSRGIVIDLGEEAYRTLGATDGARYDVSFDVIWPGEEP